MIDLLKRLLQSRYRIGVQLYLALGGAVAITMFASLVGWFSFNRVGDLQSLVNEESIPEMAVAFRVAQQSGALVAAAPRLTGASAADELFLVTQTIGAERRAFEEQLDLLMQQTDENSEYYAQIHDHAQALISNIEAIEHDVEVLLELQIQAGVIQEELVALQIRLEDILVSVIDDQFFYTLTGYQALDQPPVPRAEHFSEDEIVRYRHLHELQTDTVLATQLLANAFTVADEPLLEPLRERFEAAVGRIERSLDALGRDDPWREEVIPVFDRLFALGIGEKSGFALLAQKFQITERQQDLLAYNRELGIALGADVEGLVRVSRDNAEQATQASSLAIRTGRSLLLVLNILSISSALLIAWLFVGRVLLRRLDHLSGRMRRMAEGDLEATVDIAGRDEIADMAAALEVFRRHSLEVQRLNLVEKLAEELRGKNEQLEAVLADLQKAQDQIVMREKLAALGQLTAGVAHEIRNPLNFVKNFSEASEELLEELQEELEQIFSDSGVEIDEEQNEYFQEINDDLSGNLGRIRDHSERANRIVHDMLMMGRGTGDWQKTDINTLLDEHARLAYHSARATDSEFQLTIEMDFDPNSGLVEVIPQDLGRVFLNMVSNSCHATDERRRDLAADGTGAGGSGALYIPTLHLSTRRHEDEERFVIRIRDNGKGIPPEIVDKIFNPFFTTKPTDKGTGLGLALSSDIIREHGGTIRVESEQDEFTEMTIELPLSPARSAEPLAQLG